LNVCIDNQVFITVFISRFFVNFLGDKIMKKKTAFLIIILTLTLPLAFTLAVAEHQPPAERGKTHFDNPEFAGGKKACNSCHPNGRGLEGAGTKSSFAIMGGQQASLEEAVTMCIVNANKGDALKVLATEMQEIVSYIKSLGK
jgi:cytochrome c peroxidase